MAYKDKSKKVKYDRNYRLTHKEQRLETTKRYRVTHREELRKKGVEYSRKLKLGVLRHYSPELRCACDGCTEEHIEFLSIDHIDGGGNKHREEVTGEGEKFYRWLRRNKYPEGYRVLCHNCNQALGYLGYCPHNKETNRD